MSYEEKMKLAEKVALQVGWSTLNTFLIIGELIEVFKRVDCDTEVDEDTIIEYAQIINIRGE